MAGIQSLVFIELVIESGQFFFCLVHVSIIRSLNYNRDNV